MLFRIFGLLRAAVTMSLFILNLAIWATLVQLVGLVKLMWPAGRWRRRCVLIMAALAEQWVEWNRMIWAVMIPAKLDVRGMANVRPDGKYLILSNHLSWIDINALLLAFNRRAPFIRFFMKWILIWMPFIGLACWSLEFPFMKRHSAKYLEKHPEKRKEDLETIRRSCRHFKHIPVSILSFVEGTRFTRKKHDAQNSSYENLLEPKVGGIAYVLTSMGEQLDGILDVTLAFPGLHDTVTFLDLLSGRLRVVIVEVREVKLDPRFLDESVASPGPLREDLKAWMHGIWREKDQRIGELKG